MKILHTADWHLGKKLDNFSRLEEQVLVMNEIVEIANQQQVDLVIIAGDLFDTTHITKGAQNIVKEQIETHPQLDFLCA